MAVLWYSLKITPGALVPFGATDRLFTCVWTLTQLLPPETRCCYQCRRAGKAASRRNYPFRSLLPGATETVFFDPLLRFFQQPALMQYRQDGNDNSVVMEEMLRKEPYLVNLFKLRRFTDRWVYSGFALAYVAMRSTCWKCLKSLPLLRILYDRTVETEDYDLVTLTAQICWVD